MNHVLPARLQRMHKPLMVLLVLGVTGAGAAAAADESAAAELRALRTQLAEVQSTLRRLADENRALREHQAQLDQIVAELANVAAVSNATSLPNASALPDGSAPASAAALSPTATTATAAPGAAGPGLFGTGLRLWGYGEVYYTDPVNDRSQSQFDLARAVFGIGYRFDPRTEFNSEYEVEHAVASASDVGEFEVEQFYVDRKLNDYVSARGGLFLMPFGFLNEHHEPTNFYGVQRNFVETLIIPSTWREGGLGFHGDTAAGFGWNAGLTTGFDLSRWDFAPRSPPYGNALALEDNNVAPLQATHQELALASARKLSQYLALNYYGIPGLTLGAAVSSGDAAAGAERVTLWEGHLRWAPGRLDLQALYARGTISDTALANAANPGSPNPIPAAFYGYYVQAAYQLWRRDEYQLSPFVRFERYDLGSSYDGTPGPVIPQGQASLWPENHDRVWTTGANFYLGPHLVLKADYQWFEENRSFERFDLGLGIAF
ncbi:MAG TPA: porin [Steroidobacteraceae bacterium]|nr:porin [Steroidobacteraceae bacterium]